MGTLTLGALSADYQWASDVAFDGIRLEVLSDDRDILVVVSVPDDGRATVNTFGNDVDADLIITAIEIARRPR